MQHPAHTPAINPSTLDIQVLSIILISVITTMIIKMMMINNQVEDYIAPRFSHKRKSKLRQKILEAHANVKVEIIKYMITQMSLTAIITMHCHILSHITYILSYMIMYDHLLSICQHEGSEPD